MAYFIFGNQKKGSYPNSIWDTPVILKTGEYYFEAKVNLIDSVKIGDIIIFKEFGNQKYWGEAVVSKAGIYSSDKSRICFELSHIKRWLYTVSSKTDNTEVYHKLSNKDTRARIVSITSNDYQIIKTAMENQGVISEKRQEDLKNLWQAFNIEKRPYAESPYFQSIITKTNDSWGFYKNKLNDGTFTLDDYTNTVHNSNVMAENRKHGIYLCKFLEVDSSDAYGTSRPGTAELFGTKLNKDNQTYTIFQSGQSNIRQATRQEAEGRFNDDIKVLLTDLVNSAIDNKINIVEDRDTIMRSKQLLRKIVVMEHQQDFIYIYSNDAIDSLYAEFVNGDADNNLSRNRAVTQLLKRLFGLENTCTRTDMQILTWFCWDYYSVQGITDTSSPNVILYGPPGTGKTFYVKNNINFICQGDSSRYEIVQFHPSYTYEDFIEGIKPKGITENGNIKFELVNGAFKRFCMKAKANPTKDYYFIIDEINRANLSAVFGEILLCLERDYRHDVNDNKSLSNLVKTQYSSLIEQLGEEKKQELAYHIDTDGSVKFGIPSNVFFIGMMNDVDKSIDTFDLALRRRFKWIRMDCDYDVIVKTTKFKGKNGNADFYNIEAYKNACAKLNQYISIGLSLGKSYEFGHSFFMKMSDIGKSRNISKKNIELLFNLYLRPTLKEYMRAAYAEQELDGKLEEALNKFTEDFK
jgi:5-methylcytosine-specific restriction protein B